VNIIARHIFYKQELYNSTFLNLVHFYTSFKLSRNLLQFLKRHWHQKYAAAPHKYRIKQAVNSHFTPLTQLWS